MKQARKEDRRVARTKQAISHALVALISKRGFEDLTVQDILEEANVGRSTFYAHFEDKEDVLLQGLEELQRALSLRQGQALVDVDGLDARALVFSQELFAHAHSHRALFEAMVGRRSGALVMGHFQTMLVALVKAEVTAMVAGAGGGKAGRLPQEGVTQFVAGGLFGLLTWWMRDHRSRLGVEDINAMFRTLAIPALRAAVR